jgi:hypothetical protein
MLSDHHVGDKAYFVRYIDIYTYPLILMKEYVNLVTITEMKEKERRGSVIIYDVTIESDKQTIKFECQSNCHFWPIDKVDAEIIFDKEFILDRIEILLASRSLMEKVISNNKGFAVHKAPTDIIAEDKFEREKVIMNVELAERRYKEGLNELRRAVEEYEKRAKMFNQAINVDKIINQKDDEPGSDPSTLMGKLLDKIGSFKEYKTNPGEHKRILEIKPITMAELLMEED